MHHRPSSESDGSSASDRPRRLRDWLAEGPFALSLSAGFFGFFAHCGVLTALLEAGLVPVRASGASSGSLVAGFWGAGVDADAMLRELQQIERRDFWDPFPGPGLLRGRRLRRRLEAKLPVRTFEACRVPIAISTYDVLARRTRVIESGDLARAIHASCAVPFLFWPVGIDGRPHLDGGVRDRDGVAGIPVGMRVFHHHLRSRSARRDREALERPLREGMVSLIIDDLPRCGPSRLDRGPTAYEAALGATRRALDAAVGAGRIHERA